MGKKQFFLIDNTETTITDKVADFGANNMRKYSALDSNGRCFDFRDETDEKAKWYAQFHHFKCLLRVKSFTQAGKAGIMHSTMYTILKYKEEGY